MRSGTGKGLMIDPDVINDFNGWLYVVARSLSSDVNIREDLMQEGRVAMWQCLGKFDPDKGRLSYWLTMHARLRMLSIVSKGTDRKRTWTGAPPHRGSRIPRGQPLADATDPMVFPEAGVPFPESADLAAHLAEIRAAVAELSPSCRSAIYRKFWLDEPVNNHEWDRHRPALARKLAHLRSAI